MAGRRGRGRPACKHDHETNEERCIIACAYFQLHGKEGILADLESQQKRGTSKRRDDSDTIKQRGKCEQRRWKNYVPSLLPWLGSN